jgi:hypothetical protein
LGLLSFRYSLAHGSSATNVDGLAAYVVGADRVRRLVFEARGQPTDVDGEWSTARISLAAWAGQAIRIIFVARDLAQDSLIEAAVDDIRVERPS